MSRNPHPRRHSSSRPRRGHVPAGVRAAAGVVLVVSVLFLMAWQSHQKHQLQRDRTELTRRVEQGRDAVRRLYVQWYGATHREVIVARARVELNLHEPDLEDREVVALQAIQSSVQGPAWFESIRKGLDRYGEIRSALAGEGER